MQELTSDQMYGIAKKVNADLEKYDLATHSAIVQLIRVGMEHRQLLMQHEAAEEEKKLKEKALDNARYQMENQRRGIEQNQAMIDLERRKQSRDAGILAGQKPVDLGEGQHGPQLVPEADDANAPENKLADEEQPAEAVETVQ